MDCLRLLRAREAGVFIALFAICLFLSFATDGFLTSVNLFNVGRQISLLGIMSVGMTFVLISGRSRPFGRLELRLLAAFSPGC